MEIKFGYLSGGGGIQQKRLWISDLDTNFFILVPSSTSKLVSKWLSGS